MNKNKQCCVECEHNKTCKHNVTCPMGNFDEYDYDKVDVK